MHICSHKFVIFRYFKGFYPTPGKFLCHISGQTAVVIDGKRSFFCKYIGDQFAAGSGYTADGCLQIARQIQYKITAFAGNAVKPVSSGKEFAYGTCRIGPTGSISASGQCPAPAWMHHVFARSNIS